MMGPEIFDDRVRMAREGLDLDIFDHARLLLGDDVDLDDRAAVERAVDPNPRNNPEFNVCFVDWVVRLAKLNKADWDERKQQEKRNDHASAL